LRQHAQGTPPMDITRLLEQVAITAEERRELADLLALKAVSSEMGTGAALPSLDAMIADEVAQASAAAFAASQDVVDPELVAMANRLLASAAAFADQRAKR